jgi:hypothetical protein
VGTAQWYGGTIAQKIQGEINFQGKRKNRSNGKNRNKYNDLVQSWAILNTVSVVWVQAGNSRLMTLSNR